MTSALHQITMSFLAEDEDTKQLTQNPLLVTGGSVNPGKQGVTGLTFKTQGGAEIKISLNKTLLHALCRLLIETTMRRTGI